MDGHGTSESSWVLNTENVKITFATVAMVWADDDNEHSLGGPLGRTYKLPLTEESTNIAV